MAPLYEPEDALSLSLSLSPLDLDHEQISFHTTATCYSCLGAPLFQILQFYYPDLY